MAAMTSRENQEYFLATVSTPIRTCRFSPMYLLIFQVDCTNDASNITCTKSKVRYVPSIVLFQNGANVKSFGDRKRDEGTELPCNDTWKAI
jgi:hypothetical protein